MLIRYGLMVLTLSLVASGKAADNSQFTKPDPAAPALIQAYKQQQGLSAQPGTLSVYFLTDDNSVHKLAVRCHWSVPANDLDRAFNDDKNKIRSRIVISNASPNRSLLFKINLIDDTRTSEQADLQARITPSSQPITLANWNSTNDGQPRHNIVVIEYPN
jgi:hypothetical protein